MRPVRLRLFGKRWTVDYRALEGDDIGECDIEGHAIAIKEGLKAEQERSTLLHECIHAISDSLGLGLTERQVQGLETGLYDLNNSNPRLFSYLRQKYADSQTKQGGNAKGGRPS
jgi:hypothetical protein